MKLKILLGFLLAVAIAGLSKTTVADAAFTLVYTANLNGELEPCGCAEESNLGGLRRQGQVISELRKSDPDLFLVSAGGLLVSELPSDRTKSEYILKGMALTRYDAVGVQWRDFAFGDDLLMRSGLPWVISNVPGERFPRVQRVRHGSIELAVFSWLDPRGAPPMSMPPSADTKALAAAIKDARAAGALTLLLTTLPLDEARALVPGDDLDILVLHAPDEAFRAPQRSGRTVVLTPGTRGMRFGVLKATLDADRRIRDFEHQVIKMPADVPDAAFLDDWYKEYTAKLKEDYLRRVEIRKALNAGTPDYVGADVCKTCHGAEYEKWTTTRHHHAWEALEGVNKTYDPNCIGCHTVGYDKPGGYIDPSMTDHLTGVQCENCHGAGRVHVESGGTKLVANKGWPPKQMCAQCHVGSHSPTFVFENYWPKIAHGRAKE